MTTAIIFGGKGQTGYYLSQILASSGAKVIQASRSSKEWNVDVSDFVAVEEMIRAHRPDFVFHLAASSTTRHEALFDNHRAIASGALNILESVYRHAPGARVFITGSGVQFVNLGEPIDENTPFEASSPYSLARIHSVYAARYYRNKGLACYIGYLFHHDSPLRPAQHVSQKVALAVRAIAAGLQDTLEMGDLSVSKEWTFAGDVAEAISILVAQDRIFEAVIGSGEDFTIEQWIQACFSLKQLDWTQHVRQPPFFETEYKRLVSNPELIFSLGWRPKMQMQELARLMVEGAGGS